MSSYPGSNQAPQPSGYPPGQRPLGPGQAPQPPMPPGARPMAPGFAGPPQGFQPGGPMPSSLPPGVRPGPPPGPAAFQPPRAPPGAPPGMPPGLPAGGPPGVSMPPGQALPPGMRPPQGAPQTQPGPSRGPMSAGFPQQPAGPAPQGPPPVANGVAQGPPGMRPPASLPMPGGRGPTYGPRPGQPPQPGPPYTSSPPGTAPPGPHGQGPPGVAAPAPGTLMPPLRPGMGPPAFAATPPGPAAGPRPPVVSPPFGQPPLLSSPPAADGRAAGGYPPQARPQPPPPTFGAAAPPPNMRAGLPAPPMAGGAAPPRFGPAPPGAPPGAYAPGGQPPGAYGGMPAPGYDAAAQPLLEQFDSLQLGPAGPGQPAEADAAAFPRPAGEELEAASRAPPSPFPGNCDTRFMRLTATALPNSQATRARFSLPLGAIVHPLAEPQDVPVINLGSAGVIRCRRCRTYINPFVQWVDGGRRFQCNVCQMMNDVPNEYLCQLDANNRRLDADQRPELSSGSVEWVAPQEYMVRAPMPPTFLFVIDVSAPAVSSGMVAVAAAAIKASLDGLPGGERTLIGFLTYDAHLHFYNLKATLTQPQMMVVSEVEDPFVPLPDDLLVNLAESRKVVDALLDALPQTFASNGVIESAMGPALSAAFMVMSPIGGKLLLFQASPPSIGPGKIRNRDNAAQWNTDSEHKIRIPEDAFFKKFAAECSRVQISVDIFCGSPSYTDLASLGALPKYTCGQLYYYPRFDRSRDSAKLEFDIKHNLTRPTGWEAVMRIRCSKGLRISSFHGHFFIRSSDLLALPQIDPDKAFAVQIVHEESVVAAPVSYLQCALLYTSSSGERRIRVHTLAVPIVQELGEVYRSVDGAAMACLLGKLAVEKSYNSRMEETRQAVVHKVVLALREFRLLQAQRRAHVPPNLMVFPDSLRYLPIFTLGLTKLAALRGQHNEVSTDDRIFNGLEVMAAPTPHLLRLTYPALHPVADPAGPWGRPDNDGRVPWPLTVPLSMASLHADGAFLLDTGRMFVLWIGRSVPPQFLEQVFGADAPRLAPDAQLPQLEPARPTEMSQRINALISDARRERPIYQASFAVRQGTVLEQHLMPFMVEDRTASSPSYADFMQMVHKQVLSTKP